MNAARTLAAAPALRLVPADRRRRRSRHFFPPAYVATEACARWGVTFDAVAGRGRTAHVAAARADLVRQLRAKTAMSYAEIGEFLGGRCHTTILEIEKGAQ